MFNTRRRAPAWFRLVGIVLLLWGLMGVAAWAQQLRLGADAMGPASAYDRTLYASLPRWYNAVYGAAVLGGLTGSVALLARSRMAQSLFLLSLLAVLVQFGWLFAATDIVAAKGARTVVPFPLVIAAVAVFEVWFANRSAERGWIA